ncbi:hypothetical protein V4V36_00470 [Paenibacillus lautus]|uniref:hypothetical protein n=1 Tax=Paenibacillus lautus TaxID=1401 RepID=UPI002FBF11D2
MKFIIRLNMAAALYALFPFAGIELMVNVYRIGRLTGWDLDRVNALTLVFCAAGFILSGWGIPRLVRHWLNGRKTSFFALLLWIPYFMMLIYITAAWFPITNPADKPDPVTGLIAIAGLALYPFYLAILHLFGIAPFSGDPGENPVA